MPLPHQGWANFHIMMDCTPESGHRHSVFILWMKGPFLSSFQRTPTREDAENKTMAKVVVERTLSAFFISLCVFISHRLRKGRLIVCETAQSVIYGCIKFGPSVQIFLRLNSWT